MDETYDAVVLGTGLTECIISGLLSVDGLKVLHMDRNNYYGGQSTSFNLNQLWEKFRPGQTPPSSLGASRDYNVDMVPKFIMANGNLVKVLIKTDVTKYLEFKAVDGSFVLNGPRIEKVPITAMEAFRSPLMGLFEKRRAAKFFSYVQAYEPDDPKTHGGRNLERMSMRELYEAFGLLETTIDFVGHALALHTDESYVSKPAQPTVLRIKLYYDSLMRFYDQGIRSPYIYPLYGLGELPQAFARLSAVYGGTYMLSKPDVHVVYDDAGAATGVTSEGETVQAKFVVGDPSARVLPLRVCYWHVEIVARSCIFGYFPGKVEKAGKVVRAIAILAHPIPNTDNAASAQIILPQRQTGRKNDIYVFCCSASHHVCAPDKWLAFVSTIVETTDPERELAPGLALLGPIEEKFVDVTDLFAPMEDGTKDKAFISRGYDATSHFETTVEDVLDMYQRITGKPLDLSQTQDVSQANTDV